MLAHLQRAPEDPGLIAVAIARDRGSHRGKHTSGVHQAEHFAALPLDLVQDRVELVDARGRMFDDDVPRGACDRPWDEVVPGVGSSVSLPPDDLAIDAVPM